MLILLHQNKEDFQETVYRDQSSCILCFSSVVFLWEKVKHELKKTVFANRIKVPDSGNLMI